VCCEASGRPSRRISGAAAGMRSGRTSPRRAAAGNVTRDVHLVLDNCAAHKTPEVRTWLHKHPRFKQHFTPTSASCLNMVERFFAEITTKRIRRGSQTSVCDLQAAICDYLGQHNTKPKLFTWIKAAECILTRERRALDKLDEIRRDRWQVSVSEH
jgi:hypothetical protein